VPVKPAFEEKKEKRKSYQEARFFLFTSSYVADKIRLYRYVRSMFGRYSSLFKEIHHSYLRAVIVPYGADAEPSLTRSGFRISTNVSEKRNLQNIHFRRCTIFHDHHLIISCINMYTYDTGTRYVRSICKYILLYIFIHTSDILCQEGISFIPDDNSCYKFCYK